jgi:phosphatidylinositol alpha-1,6-mannosyltransferase
MGLDSLTAGSGGIARVARLMVRFINNLEYIKPSRFKIISYGDKRVPKDIDLPINALSRSKIMYFFQVQKATFNHSHFIYDFVGLARAHDKIVRFGKPFLAWIHGIEVWENARPIYASLAKRATILVSNSTYTLKRAEGIHGPFSNARICWLATETDFPSTLDPPSDNCATVTIISRIDKQTYKGHYPLIECWPDVVASVPSARLQIVGEGPGMGEIQRAAENSSVAHHIVFQGFVPDELMEKVWKQTTLLAMPSRGEGFGLVYIEAMRHGRPVIASIHDAAPEINIDGYTGYNVDLDVPGQLASRIVNLLTDHNKVIEMGMNGKRRWKQHFCYSAFKSRFLPIFNDFIQ